MKDTLTTKDGAEDKVQQINLKIKLKIFQLEFKLRQRQQTQLMHQSFA